MKGQPEVIKQRDKAANDLFSAVYLPLGTLLSLS